MPVVEAVDVVEVGVGHEGLAPAAGKRWRSVWREGTQVRGAVSRVRSSLEIDVDSRDVLNWSKRGWPSIGDG